MTTANLLIGRNADDTQHSLAGFDDVHTFSAGTTDIRVGSAYFFFGNNRYGGSLLYTVPIGNNATITSATITFTASSTQMVVTCKGVFDADDVDNSPIIPSDAEWDAITKTTATVAWDPIPQWTLNQEYTSPELKTIIQEIVDRPGWQWSNAINIFLHDDADGSSNLANRAWWANITNDPRTLWPRLDIDFTGGAKDVRAGPMMGSANMGMV